MTFYALSALANTLSGLAVGIAVLWQSDRKGKNLVCGFLSLFIGLWSLFYYLWLGAGDMGTAVFYNQILTFWAIFLPFLFFHFITYATGATDRYRRWIWAGYFFSGVLGVLNFTPYFVRALAPRGDFPYWPIPGPGFTAYFFLFVIYMSMGGMLLLREGLASAGLRRRRMMYSVAGTVLVILAGATNFPLLYGINFPPIGNVLASFIVIHILLAHTGTFTRRAVIASSYVLLLGFLGAVLFVAWKTARVALPESMRELSAATLFALCGAGAPFFFPKFQRMVDRAYYPEHSERSEKLALLERRLRDSPTLKEFNETLVSGVREIFGAAEAWLADGGGPACGEDRVAVPFKAGRVSATLVLGRKESGLPYSDQEIREVSAFAGLAAVVSKVDRLQELLLRNERLAAIGEMSSVVSHELKTPLAVIQNSLFFLRRKDAAALDEKSLKHLENIEDQTRVLKGIVSDILDYARDRAPSRAEGDLGTEVRRLCDTIPVPADVRLAVEVAPDLPPASFDAREIRQALSNLLTNAFQSMPEGGAVKVAVRRAAEGVEVSVSDGGCGIPPGDMARIFEPFFTTKSSGTGLGLAVVKKVVEGHAGTIEVKSRPGAGTDVVVRLPAGDFAKIPHDVRP